MEDEKWMREALALAQKAAALEEVPVGCVIVRDGEIVGRGYNRRQTDRNALHHAELLAIDEACRTLGGWRLWQCTLYVTLEPCVMCGGAIVNARLQRVVYGAADPKAGACGGVLNVLRLPGSYRPELCGGVLEHECGQCLSAFFERLRQTPRIPWKRPAP